MQLKYGGDLYKLLIHCCPASKDENKSITRLAWHLGITDSGVRKWLKADRISGQWARKIVALKADKKISVADFDRWVYKS